MLLYKTQKKIYRKIYDWI